MDSVEVWVAVEGYPGYEVSNQGRVRSKKAVLKAAIDEGYPRVSLYRNRKAKNKRIHWLVAAAFLGPRPDGLEINHKDGCKTNNAADNLEYVTRTENIRHAMRSGLIDNYGSRNPCAKLTEEMVREIRRIGGKIRGNRIAAMYGVSKATVSMILSGKVWGHLT